jgi:hypothetical protein
MLADAVVEIIGRDQDQRGHALQGRGKRGGGLVIKGAGFDAQIRRLGRIADKGDWPRALSAAMARRPSWPVAPVMAMVMEVSVRWLWDGDGGFTYEKEVRTFW